MKKRLLTLALLVSFVCFGQETIKNNLKFNPNLSIIKAKASCGICMFDMQGEKCELAVQFNDSKYYVEGADIDDYGDAHSDEGFCNAIIDVSIQGEIINNTFLLTFFKVNNKNSEEVLKP